MTLTISQGPICVNTGSPILKPGSCPNSINIKTKGVLPAAILGTDNFDVQDIDRTSIRVAGVAPIRSVFRDVETPFEPFTGKESPHDCNGYGPDGFMDLTVKFKAREIIEALGQSNDGDVFVLEITGALKDGTSIQGEDVVIILKKGKKKISSRRLQGG